ncbi:hypothetical protein [Allobaculum stercoricanis]|uniref:hypothetical protein n=1 Tax=Allobaculum stercoricanis TaxID=174709 RepID=UPI0003719130|nr:hypothetical protein [Allobaculum stercoricanis]
MSNETNSMKVAGELGTIVYNRNVFATIARNVIEDEKNVELVDNTKISRNDRLATIEDGKLYLTIPVRIGCQANVSDVCANLQNKIFETIEYMTEYKPEAIKIQVVGFIF